MLLSITVIVVVVVVVVVVVGVVVVGVVVVVVNVVAETTSKTLSKCCTAGQLHRRYRVLETFRKYKMFSMLHFFDGSEA